MGHFFLFLATLAKLQPIGGLKMTEINGFLSIIWDTDGSIPVHCRYIYTRISQEAHVKFVICMVFLDLINYIYIFSCVIYG